MQQPVASKRTHVHAGAVDTSEPNEQPEMTPAELLASDKLAFIPSEVSQILGVDARTIRRACADGQIPSFKIGRLVLIPREGLLRMLSGEQTTASVRPEPKP